MKKFYKEASLVEKEDKYFIGLDGRCIKTPMGSEVSMSSKPLAAKLVAEWNAQGEEIIPASMPLTQIVTTHIDKTIGQRESIYQTILPYVHGDTIIYFHGDEEDLLKLQEKNWLPLIQDFEKKFDVSYTVQKDISAKDQNEKVFKQWKNIINELSDEELTVFQVSVSLTASPILSWNFLQGKLSVEEIINHAFLEEIFQSKNWGIDPEMERKQASVKKELYELKEYLSLIQT